MVIKCEHCKKRISTIIEYKKKKNALLDKNGWRLDGPTCFECLKDVDNRQKELRRKWDENH